MFWTDAHISKGHADGTKKVYTGSWHACNQPRATGSSRLDTLSPCMQLRQGKTASLTCPAVPPLAASPGWYVRASLHAAMIQYNSTGAAAAVSSRASLGCGGNKTIASHAGLTNKKR